MNWIKTSTKTKLSYALKNGEQTMIDMKIENKSGTASIDIPILKHQYSIKKASIWNNNLIIEKDGVAIGESKAEKIYSNKFVITLNGSTYKYFYRNNPLVEIVLFDAKTEEDLLTCVLFPKGKGEITTQLRMFNAGNKCKDIMLLQAFIWYLFFPIAMENSNDEIVSLIMMGG